jgi:hypothetical protein
MAPPRNEFKGVRAFHNKWRASVTVDGEHRHLGTYSTPEEAARAYDRAAIEAWGLGNCYLNFGMTEVNASRA